MGTLEFVEAPRTYSAGIPSSESPSPSGRQVEESRVSVLAGTSQFFQVAEQIMWVSL